MVNRVVAKAKEIANYAMENSYSTDASASVDFEKLEFDHVNDNLTIVRTNIYTF